MGKFTFTPTGIEGVLLIGSTIYGDDRGYFTETYQQEEFRANGIDSVFVQDNQSKSTKGVLRGLHFQVHYPQAKLVRVLDGIVYDVAVDIRPDSPTYGKSYGVLLNAADHQQLYIPRGLAHGFLVLSESAVFAYKCDEFYHPEDEGGYRWDDPTFAIPWPKLDIPYRLSEKDQHHPYFQKEKSI